MAMSFRWLMPLLMLASLTALAGCRTGPGAEPGSHAAAGPAADAYLIGHCALPPRTRHSGGLVIEIPRRPVRTTQADCAAQSGRIVPAETAWGPLARHGDVEAQAELANALALDANSDADCRDAARLYRGVIESADSARRVPALFSLAYLHETGCGVPRDPERARALYSEALALRGDAAGVEPRVDLGRFQALVIGIDDYAHLPPLATAAADARAVAEVLSRDYGFDVQLLLDGDATRARILETLEGLRRRLTEQDNLLIYYAGHGVIYGDEQQHGAWQPVDARHDSRTHWIRTRDVTEIVDTMLAGRVLIVADSCFSGAWTRSVFPDLYPDKAAFWVERLALRRARLTLASGGLEPVPDQGGGGHSVFARHLLDALRDNRDLLIGRRLFDYLDLHVPYATGQEPVYAPMRYAAHEGGEFFFRRREATARAGPAVPQRLRTGVVARVGGSR